MAAGVIEVGGQRAGLGITPPVGELGLEHPGGAGTEEEPTRRLPQRAAHAATASMKPSCAIPSCARRLLRQSKRFSAGGVATSSTAGTSPM